MPNPQTLTGDQRRRLKQQAHHLKPVVLLGAAGFTEAVLAEIELALDHHELIKVRLSAEDRTARDGQAAAIAARTGAALLQRIGHVASFYRANPRRAVAATPASATPPGNRPTGARSAARPPRSTGAPGEVPRRPAPPGDAPAPVGLKAGRRPRPAEARPAPVGLVARRGEGRGQVRTDGPRTDGFRNPGGPRPVASRAGPRTGPRPGSRADRGGRRGRP